MTNEEFFEFCKNAHAGQTRWGGEDYFTHHCVPVAEYALEHYKDFFQKDWWSYIDYHKDLVYNIGIAHDLIEDTGTPLEVLSFNDLLMHSVNHLTKKENQSYAEYIENIAKRSVIFTKLIKLSDLTLNSRDLKPGSRKDKYELAKLVIMNSII